MNACLFINHNEYRIFEIEVLPVSSFSKSYLDFHHKQYLYIDLVFTIQNKEGFSTRLAMNCLKLPNSDWTFSYPSHTEHSLCEFCFKKKHSPCDLFCEHQKIIFQSLQTHPEFRFHWSLYKRKIV